MPRIKLGTHHVGCISLINLALVILFSSLGYYVRYQSYIGLKESNESLKFSDVVVPAIQLVPNHFVFYPWTLIISPYVQTSPLQFLFALPVMFFGTEYLESNWNFDDAEGLRAPEKGIFGELIRYLLIVTVTTNLICILFKSFAVVFGMSAADSIASPTNFGIFTILMSFIVVVKQLSPESNVKVFSFFRFRLKRLPFIVLSLALVVSLVIFRSFSPFFMPLFVNFYISWFYLRYYQINHVGNILPTTASESHTTSHSSTVRGDASDTFAFIQFFPDNCHDYLKPIARFFYHSSAFLGLFRPFNDDDIESSNLRTIQRLNKSNTIDANGSSGESSRRKRIALKVLEQKVGNTGASPASESSVANENANTTTPKRDQTAKK